MFRAPYFPAVVFVMLTCPTLVLAEPWQNRQYNLSMEGPSEWAPISDEVLEQANTDLTHYTGQGFIVGYAPHDADEFAFPYVLVQFKYYDELPEASRIEVQPDEYSQLKLIYHLVSPFQKHGVLPDDIDAAQFIKQFDSDDARLVRLDHESGRFEVTGTLSHQADDGPVRYHTHGVLGKEGLAIATFFATDDFFALVPIIQNELKTLAFDENFRINNLPPRPTQFLADAQAASTPRPVQATQPEVESLEPATQQVVEQPVKSDALVIILSAFGALLFLSIPITWFITHQKAAARRERRIARRERREQMYGQQPYEPIETQEGHAAGQSRRSNSRPRQRAARR